MGSKRVLMLRCESEDSKRAKEGKGLCRVGGVLVPLVEEAQRWEKIVFSVHWGDG